MADEFLSKIRLKDNKDSVVFKPFKVSSSVNSILKPIIDAFNLADQVAIGYSTLEKNKGFVKPTLKKKSLYLTGGALRDHLKNKTFKNYDLVTDATPDEIKMILENSETNFIFLANKEKTKDTDFIFYPSRFDQENKMIELTVEKNHQKVHIATLSENNKDRNHKALKTKFTTSIEKDAHTRDLTINALYLKLKNSDGENSELLDPVGGSHDLRSGQLVTVNDPEKTFKMYPYLAFKIAKLAAKYSEDKKIPEKYTHIFKNKNIDLDLNYEVIKEMFVKTIEDQTISLYDYLTNLKNITMLAKLFPNLHITDIKNDLPNHRITLIAYLIYKNAEDKIKQVLSHNGWKNDEIEEIINYVKLAKWCMTGNNIEEIQNMFRKPSRLPNSRIQEFLDIFERGYLYEKITGQKTANAQYGSEKFITKIKPISYENSTENNSDININRYIKRND